MGRALAIVARVGRLIAVIAAILAVIIAIGIVFRVLKANPDNSIVSLFDGLARTLVGPFDGMFDTKDPRAEIAINWGIALVVYLLVGQLIERVLRRVGALEP